VIETWGQVFGFIVSPLSTVIDLLGGLEAQTYSLNDALESDEEWIRLLGEQVREQTQRFREMQQKAAIATAAMEAQTGAVEDQTGATEELTGSTRENIAALRDQRLAVLALSDQFLGIIDSASQVSEAQRTLNELERRGREDTKAYEAAVLDALEAQIGLEDAVLSYGQELVDSGEKSKAVKEKIRELGNQFGIQDGIIADLIQQVQQYIRELNSIPSNVNTTVHVSGGGTTGGVFAQRGFHGEVRRPTVFVAGEAGPERVDISPQGHGGGGLDDVTADRLGRAIARHLRLEPIVVDVSGQVISVISRVGSGRSPV
jgi:SMC interacting uncharacterized protein involved in chromosome segregation